MMVFPLFSQFSIIKLRFFIIVGLNSILHLVGQLRQHLNIFLLIICMFDIFHHGHKISR